MIRFTVPLRLVSEANTASHAHWRARHARVADQRFVIARVLDTHRARRPVLPARVTIVRIAPRSLDSDNLVSSTKACRDQIAKWFKLNDKSPLFEWCIGQRKGKPNEYAVMVQIEAIEKMYRPLMVLRDDEVAAMESA